MTTQRGFTLIELVVVIVILGLLAAAALPKFISVGDDARRASVSGVAGGLQSAVALARAQYVVNGSNAAASVLMEATTVATLDETTYAGMGGRPTCAGIRDAMDDPQGYSFVPLTAAACTAVTDAVTYTPQGGGPNCSVTYTPNGTPTAIVIDVSAC